jgi:hypothetical protein
MRVYYIIIQMYVRINNIDHIQIRVGTGCNNSLEKVEVGTVFQMVYIYFLTLLYGFIYTVTLHSKWGPR